MTSIAFQKDVGAFLKVLNAVNPAEVTAASTAEDNVEVNGVTVDRISDIAGTYLSAKVAIPYSYALSATETGTIKVTLQHSSLSSAGWADFNDKDGSTANTATFGTTGSTAAQTGNGQLAIDVDLNSKKRYVRIQVLPNLSETGTGADDTVDYGGVWVFAGADTLPAG